MSDVEEIYFDVNKEAENKEQYSFRENKVNQSSSLFAYTFSLSGSMECILKVRDLETKIDYDWQIENTTGDFIWVNDNEIYFIERDEFSRGNKLFKINARKGPDSKKLIYSKPEKYKNMYMAIDKTTDKKYVLLAFASMTTDIIYIAETGSNKFDEFICGKDNTKYTIDHHNGYFYILTNDGAVNFQILKTKVEKNNWKRACWESFISENENKYLKNIHIYNDYIIIESNNDELGLPELSICNLNETNIKIVKMPEVAYELSFLGAWDHNSTKLRFNFETPITPPQIIELDVTNLALKVLDTYEIPNYSSKDYILKREYVKVRDKEIVPMTIVYKKGLELNGNNPAYVHGYGSYGYNCEAYYDVSLFSLINRGFVYCIVHARGGSEKGHKWHLDGKMRNKMNTFNDFIDCCEHIIDTGYTSPKNITIHGGSAGGLLVGAVTNMRPDLLKTAIAEVPFVDILNTISDESLPMSAPDWEEFGNPVHNEEEFKFLLSYSPYENIKNQDYPSMLYKSAIADENVTYWEPTKMVAKLRELKTDDNLLLLSMNLHAGHFGASKRYEYVEEIAFVFSFVLKAYGIRDK